MKGQAQVVAYDGRLEAIMGPETTLCGETLAQTVEQWEGRFGFPITCASRQDPDGFAIRLHGAGDRVADELREALEQMLAVAQPEEKAPMEVRYVWRRRAFLEPCQWTLTGRLLKLAKSLGWGSVQQPVSVALVGNALCLCVQRGLRTTAEYDAALTDLLSPTYTLHSDVRGGIHAGVARVRMTMPGHFQLRGSALPKLPFVLADPAPAQSMTGEPVTLYLSAKSADVEKVWRQAAEAALSVGAYPVGDFSYDVSRRLTHVYHPLTISGR